MLHRGDNEERHFLHAEVVRDIRVELAAQVCQTASLILLYGELDGAQDGVTFKYGLLGELAEWHPPHIDIHGDYAGLHELLIKEELNQGLHGCVKSRG